MARDYAILFGRGLLIVSLVSANTWQVSHEHYVGATIVGGLISLVWYYNARLAARTDLPYGGIAYAVGAALGTLTGMTVMARFWGS